MQMKDKLEKMLMKDKFEKILMKEMLEKMLMKEMLISQIFSVFFSDNSIRLVAFIPYQDFVYISLGICFNLLNPVSYILKRILVSNIICQNNSMSSFVISFGYSTNLSCPAVSHICNLITFPSGSIILILKAIPIVVRWLAVKESSVNRKRIHVLPTPDSPIMSNLNKQSYFFDI